MIKISPKIDTKEVEKIFNSHSASMMMNVPGNINGHNVFQIVNVCSSQVEEQVDLFPQISPQIEAMLTPRTSFSRRDPCSVLTSHLLLTSLGNPTKIYNNVYYGVHVYTPLWENPPKCTTMCTTVYHLWENQPPGFPSQNVPICILYTSL